MTTLNELVGSRWQGQYELWLDPLGNDVTTCEGTLELSPGVVAYTWSYKGEPHKGKLVLTDNGANFSDSWHQPNEMLCTPVAESRALLCVLGYYGDDKDWGWRSMLSYRAASDQLVLQMTNIAPWGEEARAVRLVGTRQ